MNFKSFYQELKRRKVFKVGSYYVVSSWVIIQVVTTIFPQLDLPVWTVKGIIALCFFGLPVAILAAWVYEIIPDEESSDLIIKRVGRKHYGNRIAKITLLVYILVSIVGIGIVFKIIINDSELKEQSIISSSLNETDNVESRLDDVKFTIAVLPFANLSDDINQDFFSDGLTDEIRYMLSKIPNLRVISRTSCMFYKNKNIPLDEISKELKATHILEGSVRKSDDKLRINLNLLNVEKDELIWSMPPKNHDIAEIFEVQNFIAEEVLAGLKIKLMVPIKEVSVKKYTDNIEVYTSYLRAQKMLDELTPEVFNDIEQIYIRLTEMDSNFLYAYTGLVTLNVLKGTIWGSLSSKEAKQKAKKYLEKAKLIDSVSTAYHLVNGQFEFYLNYDFEKGESEFIKAMEGGDTWAPILLSDLYIKKGEIDKSIEVTKYLAKIDPINVALAVQEGCNLFYKGQKEEAEIKLENALSFHRGYPQYFRILAQVHLYLGDAQEAIDVIERGFDSLGYRPTFLTSLSAISYNRLGDMEKFEKLVKELKELHKNNNGGDPAFFIGQVYAGVGEIQKSLKWLNISYAKREVELTWLNVDSAFYILKGLPEYEKLVANINLSELKK